MLSLSYDPLKLPITAAHIGTGAFHRAHQQSYYDDLAQAGIGIAVHGINLAPPDIANLHKAQGGCYHIMTEDQCSRSLNSIGTLRSAVSKPDALDPAWDEISFVTLTITEKGYCHRLGASELDPESAIATDLANPENPTTAPGFLCRMLERRRLSGAGGITLASCDNITANGELLRGVMDSYAREAWPQLVGWMQDNVAFPQSMVDRIVPVMTTGSAERLRNAIGKDDPLGVVSEPFRQWVLEDKAASHRPELERVGVQIVPNVTIFEHIKYRLLNGLQTALAEIGRLVGHQTSCDAACDPVLAKWSRYFMAQQIETLTCPEGENLWQYAETSLARLTNPMIQHPLSQIASDASFKMPQRLITPAAERRVHGLDAEPYAIVVASWIHLSERLPADRFGLNVKDPIIASIAALRNAARTPDAIAKAVLRHPLFSQSLSEDMVFEGQVSDWLAFFQKDPSADAIRHRLYDSIRSSSNGP